MKYTDILEIPINFISYVLLLHSVYFTLENTDKDIYF